MTRHVPLVILLDVDNTLLDTDTFKRDLDAFLEDTYGARVRQRFWVLYEDVRRELEVVNFAVVAERLQHEAPAGHAFSEVTDFLMRYPYRRRRFPGVVATLRHLHTLGTPVVLTDGDPWYQAKKVTDAGIWSAVGGNVLIFTHKEDHLDEVRRWFPADHYVFVDDKPRLVAGIKARMGAAVTAIWVRQGSYAAEGWPEHTPPPDIALAHIAELRGIGVEALQGPLLVGVAVPADGLSTWSNVMVTAPTRRRFTVNEYYGMVAKAIIGQDERVELLDGEVIAMAAMGSRHTGCTNATAR